MNCKLGNIRIRLEKSLANRSRTLDILLISPGALPLSNRWLIGAFWRTPIFWVIRFTHILLLFHAESKHFDSSPSSICRMSVNGFSCAPAESAVAQLRNIWSGKIMDRSFGTLVYSWGFFSIYTYLIPSPTPINNVGRSCVCRNFSEYQLCAGWMKEKLQENFEKEALSLFMRTSRKYRKLWILHYCPKEFCPGL